MDYCGGVLEIVPQRQAWAYAVGFFHVLANEVIPALKPKRENPACSSFHE